MFGCFCIDPLPGCEGPGEAADMDEVESFVVGPLPFCIVELEEQVLRCASWLHRGGDVRCNDLRIGEALCDSDGPVCGTGADVEDASCGGRDM